MQNSVNLNEEKPSLFIQEWSILHNDHEKYERYSLLIKLSSVFVSLVAVIFEIPLIIAIFFVGIVWLQDGIWKTFQSRMSDRILLIERYIKEQASRNTDEVAFQFYSGWEKSPKGTKRLLGEYIRNSIRPTVAYPYIILILLLVAVSIFS